jgi:glutamine synthetase
MRQPGGLTEIEAAIDKLSRQHIRHIKAYDPNEGIQWDLNLSCY